MSCIPTLWLHLKTSEIQLQFVTDSSFRRTCRCRVGGTGKSAFVDSIIVRRDDKSIVTTAYYLVVDNHLIAEVDGRLTLSNHTTYVTTTVERTELGRIFFVRGFTI